MTSINERYFDEVINAPVVTLTKGLPLNDLINNHEAEFEVRADSDEDESVNKLNSAESCFNFNDLETEINLNLIDDEEEDGIGSPFDKYRKKMTKLRDDGKIMKYVLKQGAGCTVPENCLVYVRYKAYVEYQEVPFDSTFMQSNATGNFSIPLNLGKGQVLPGLHEAILSMRKGEKAEFLVHPDLAYGKMGCPPRIPEEATILFLVEIDRFVDCGDIYTNYDDLSMEERLQFSNIYQIAKAYYELGNDYFKKENYSSAITRYRRVINMLHNARLANEEEENTRNHFLIKNYSNACICYNKLKNYKKVCIMASDAVKVSQREAFKNYKLLYFWGVAKMHLNDLEGAKKHLMSAKKLMPLNADISTALSDLARKKANAERAEKLMMRKVFGFHYEPPKVREINEAEESFKESIKKHLQDFKMNPDTNSLILKDIVTVYEEEVCINVAKEMGLYARVAEGDMRVIHVKKPAE